MRRHQTHAGIESRDQIRPNLRKRHLKRRRQLLGDLAERNVALPEHGAARLDCLHTDVAAVVVKDVPHGRLLRHRVDDLRALAELVLRPEPVGGVHRKCGPRDPDRRVDVGKFEVILVAKRVEKVAREPERTRIVGQRQPAEIVELFVLSLHLIEPRRIETAGWRGRRLARLLVPGHTHRGQPGERCDGGDERSTAVW